MKKIGLALGGGAVLGAAHIGVLKALEEKQVRIEYITGTSIGAFVAALFAFGKNWEEINEISCKLKWMDISSISLSESIFSPPAMTTGTRQPAITSRKDSTEPL